MEVVSFDSLNGMLNNYESVKKLCVFSFGLLQLEVVVTHLRMVEH